MLEMDITLRCCLDVDCKVEYVHLFLGCIFDLQIQLQYLQSLAELSENPLNHQMKTVEWWKDLKCFLDPRAA